VPHFQYIHRVVQNSQKVHVIDIHQIGHITVNKDLPAIGAGVAIIPVLIPEPILTSKPRISSARHAQKPIARPIYRRNATALQCANRQHSTQTLFHRQILHRSRNMSVWRPHRHSGWNKRNHQSAQSQEIPGLLLTLAHFATPTLLNAHRIKCNGNSAKRVWIYGFTLRRLQLMGAPVCACIVTVSALV